MTTNAEMYSCQGLWRLMTTFVVACSVCQGQKASAGSVKAWEGPMVIPTYRVKSPDPNPMFYEREPYQGAQKRVYPYALQDGLSHVREDRTYNALHLENEYVTLTVLPEIGGRLFGGTDKTNGYDFFYRQHVIKPALVGMLGAWISGGVEWCAFHHHRNTTFMPVDYRLVENPDGSKTIWVGEIERRHRMKWLVGLTLHPGKSYIEATVKFFNRTPQPHSILYWANVAVHVNEDYQIVFPPSVQVATHHSKFSFTHWPISQGVYRGRDYTGLDVSWYRNLAWPVSFFAWDLQEDFMGGYDHGRRAGLVHVGDHHTVCGAKLWSWGTGSAGQLWDKLLTDTDGPYVELMTGAWSDNQPDYSWIRPYEVKVIKQYWYPLREIGGFKNANINGAVNLEIGAGSVTTFGFHTTSRHANARAILLAKDDVLFDEVIEIAPDKPFTKELAIPAGVKATDLRAALLSADGEELVAYQPVEREPVTTLPEPVEVPPKPGDIETVEELYLTGLWIEQIHNPAVDPLDYCNEALERDPGDSRCNTILGVHANKRGQYEQAETYLRRAIERIAVEYTRPIDTEAYYQLGLALRAQGKYAEAQDSFYRASWDQAYHSASYCQLAELSCGQRAFDKALEQIDRSLSANALNTRASDIKAMILRKLCRLGEAGDQAEAVLADDPLDFLAANELLLTRLAMNDRSAASDLQVDLGKRMRDEVQSYLELASDYMGCGLWDEAIDVLKRPVDDNMPFASTYPVVHYCIGYLYERKGDMDEARGWYARGARMPADYCFPFRLEMADVLAAAIRANPSDARAHYYLGNLLYDHRPDKAIAHWRRSADLDDAFAMVHRNLGWASYRAGEDIPQAIAHYEQAIGRHDQDPRWFLELDTLYEIGNVDPQRRLAMLEPHHEVARLNQDALLREIIVLVLVGKYDQAIDYLSNNFFHAREGGKSIHTVWADAHLLRGLGSMKAGKFADALADFQRAGECPENLSAWGSEWRSPEVAYHAAAACEAMNQPEKASAFHEQGSASKGTLQLPQTRYYHALCLAEQGQKDAAGKVFDELIQTGREGLTPVEVVDFFAKFGEQETKQARIAAAHFTMGLGFLGKGQTEEARQAFANAVELNAGLVWARFHLEALR